MAGIKKIYRLKFLLRSLFSKSVLDAHIFLFTIRNIISPHKPVSAEAQEGHFFNLDQKGKESLYYWMNPDQKEYEFSMIEKFLRPGMVFVDMGSGEGFFSLAVGASVVNAKVYAFEEEKESFDILKENIKMNTFSTNITIGDQFPAGDADAGFKQAGIKKIDLLRVNAKGKELKLFESMKDALVSPDSPVIIYKTSSAYTGKFGYHPVEILWLLQDYGYSFFIPDAEGNIIVRPDREYEGFIIAKKR